MVLLLGRHLPPDGTGHRPTLPSMARLAPELLRTSLRYLQSNEGGYVDWADPRAKPLLRSAYRIAHRSRLIAEQSGLADPECAWISGLLAPLGWMAVAALDLSHIDACLNDPAFREQPNDTQLRHWGYTAASIGRRLARRWGLPGWLKAIVGYLGFTPEMAASIGADADLFAIVQLAAGDELNLVPPGHQNTRLKQANLAEADFAAIMSCEVAEPMPDLGNHPRAERLLPELLTLAQQRFEWLGESAVCDAEHEIDRLQRALAELQLDDAARLHHAKLRALAEFAAGAGHEINNPLAVISGQSQYLINRLTDATSQPALQAIIRQTQRIHQILTDLMHFARPPKPNRHPLDVQSCVAEVAAQLQDLAEQTQVRLEWVAPANPVTVVADGSMLRSALAALIRNGLEAAPAGGWVCVRVATPRPDDVEIVVEDSGDGPNDLQTEHMFDPFYSGRSAGRGRGLGLSTAWRYCVENGGDLQFRPSPDVASRFVIQIPTSADAVSPIRPERRSA
jgi:signal transduction histidine kinase